MKKIALCTVLLAAGLAFLASDTGTWKCLRLIQPEYLERGSPELDALYERRALDGQNVLVPIPPARALELLATGDENWRLPVRARLLEQTGRLEEAEAAWRHWNERTGPSAEGVTCLAAFYRRHAMARQELELLERSTALLVGGKKAPLGLAEVWNRIMSLAVPAGLKPAEQDACTAGTSPRSRSTRSTRPSSNRGWKLSLMIRAGTRWPRLWASTGRRFPTTATR